MRDLPLLGAGRVALMELRAHLRSPRLIAIVVLLALVIVGVSYGASEPQKDTFANQVAIYAHPAIRNETGTEHYLVVVFLADQYGVPRTSESVSLNEITFGGGALPETKTIGQATSNSAGFASFDIGAGQPASNRSYEAVVGTQTSQVTFPAGLRNQTFTQLILSSGFSNPFGSEFVAALHVLDLDGTPATSAGVFLDGTAVGQPDSNGFLRVAIPPGDHAIRISYRGQEVSNSVYAPPQQNPTISNGADAVLAGMAFTFLPLLLPIMAIAVSFDAIARERAQGSLELLLTKRISRPGIIAGKFAGALISVAIPMIAVLLVGMAVVTAVSGEAPTPGFAVTTLLAGLFLVSVYTLLMLVLSSLAKSVATAMVFGVAVWLVFAMLFASLTFVALIVFGASPTDRGFYGLLGTALLVDPNALYQMLVGASLPAGWAAAGSVVPVGALAPGVLVVAALAWFIGLFLLATLLFVHKVEP